MAKLVHYLAIYIMNFPKIKSNVTSACWLTILFTAAAADAQEERPSFEGFYAQLGAGGARKTTSSNVDLTMNGAEIPATMNNDASKKYWVGNMELGYNWAISQDYLIGVGAAILPMSGSQQNSTINIRGTNYSFLSGHPLYNYSVFISPMMKLGEGGVLYGKLGYQSTVVREDEVPDVSGYLFGLGYKRFFYQSFYAFGEFNYYGSANQKIHRAIGLRSGATLDARVNISPDLETLLMGVGYQF